MKRWGDRLLWMTFCSGCCVLLWILFVLVGWRGTV